MLRMWTKRGQYALAWRYLRENNLLWRAKRATYRWQERGRGTPFYESIADKQFPCYAAASPDLEELAWRPLLRNKQNSKLNDPSVEEASTERNAAPAEEKEPVGRNIDYSWTKRHNKVSNGRRYWLSSTMLGYERWYFYCGDFSPADDGKVSEAAEADARKRHREAFSKEHRSEEEPSTKRLKTAPGTVPSRHFWSCSLGKLTSNYRRIYVKSQVSAAVGLARRRQTLGPWVMSSSCSRIIRRLFCQESWKACNTWVWFAFK